MKPLARQLFNLLLAAGGPLDAYQIQSALRQSSGAALPLPYLTKVLREYPEVFVQVGDERWTLRQLLDPVAGEEPPAVAGSRPEGPPPDARGYVVFDVETTGTDPAAARLIQIAALKVVEGEPDRWNETLVNPGVALPLPITRLTGITPEQLESAPPPREALLRFREFVGDLVLVAHNGTYDVTVVNAEADRAGLPPVANPLVDTLELAVLVEPGLRQYTLVALGAHLGLAFDPESLHDARADVDLTRRVFEALRERWAGRPAWLRDTVAALLPPQEWTAAAFLPPATGPRPAAWAPILLGAIRPLRLDPLPPEPHASGGAAAGGAAPGEAALGGAAALFAPDGIVTQTKGAYRPNQERLAHEVEAALRDGRFTMIEAPTGTGKTLGALLPAVFHARTRGRPVFLSTYTMALQEQLAQEIEFVRDRLGISFNALVLKGKGNYLCPRRLESLCNEVTPGSPFPLRYGLSLVLTWVEVTRTGDLDEIHFSARQRYGGVAEVLRSLSAEHCACGPGTPYYDAGACFVHALYRQIPRAQVVVINHALLATRTRTPGRLPLPVADLIVDEAHALEDAVTGAYTEAVTAGTFAEALGAFFDPVLNRGALLRARQVRLPPVLDRQVQALLGQVRGLGVHLSNLGRALERWVHLQLQGQSPHPEYGARVVLNRGLLKLPAWSPVSAVAADLQRAGRQLIDEARRFSDELRSQKRETAKLVAEELASAALALESTLDLARELARVSNEQYVYWVELVPRQGGGWSWGLRRAPIDVGALLRRDLYDRLDSAVFLSATLTVRGSFTFAAERLGLSLLPAERRTFIRLPETFDYARQTLVLIPDYLTHPNVNPVRFQEELAQELGDLLPITRGRALCLFTSREMMQAVSGLAGPALREAGIPLLVQEPGQSRASLRRQFAEDVESVLFGLRSFWEGVDVPGEALSYVVITKLPFPQLGDPVIAARATQYRMRGRNDFLDYIVPLAVIQFRQGFGRLIRSHADKGAVVITDSRLAAGAVYSDYFLDSLPDCPVVIGDRQTVYTELCAFMDLEADLTALTDLQTEFDRKLAALTLEKPYLSPEEYEQVRDKVLAALHLFGLAEFRPAQEEVVRKILSGEDVLALLPTGAGKSLTFQLPAMLRKGLTVVVSPLKALMKDQVQGLHRRGIAPVRYLMSGMGRQRDQVYADVAAGKVRLLYISPERLRDERMVEVLRSGVVQVVLDEAHCVTTWGYDFRPDYLAIPAALRELGARPPMAALTATATPEVRQDLIEQLELMPPHIVTLPVDRPNLRFHVCKVRSEKERRRRLIGMLTAEPGAAIVYVVTRAEAENTAHFLRLNGIDARAFHGGMDKVQQDTVLEAFLDGQVRVVVATSAFGMGVDKPDIRLVIHYKLPADLESYYQQAGRAGRDGQVAHCVLLYRETQGDRRDESVHHYLMSKSALSQAVAARLLAYLRDAGAGEAYIDPSEAEEELEIPEDALRRHLHLLEQEGAVHRRPDIPSLLRIQLRTTVAEFIGAAGDLGAALVAQAGLGDFDQGTADLTALPCPLREANVAVREWARRDLIYCATMKTRLAVELTGAEPSWTPLAVYEQYESRRAAKLEQMLAYIHLPRGSCRRRYILQYFGEEAPPVCGACDNCNPHLETPWSAQLPGQVVDIGDVYDPGYTLLAVIDELGDQFGFFKLRMMLRGTDRIVVRGEPIKLPVRLRHSPYYQILSQVPDQRITAIYQRLVAEGYVESYQTHTENNEMYTFNRLTSLGRERLESGEILGW